jgi:hypothetical protein
MCHSTSGPFGLGYMDLDLDTHNCLGMGMAYFVMVMPILHYSCGGCYQHFHLDVVPSSREAQELAEGHNQLDGMLVSCC